MIDLARTRTLAELAEKLRTRGINLVVADAHGRVRDLLRAEGLSEKIPGIARGAPIRDALGELASEVAKASAADR